jgi:hypothetical protein
MGRCQAAVDPSSDNETDGRSCFDTAGEESDPDTSPPDTDADIRPDYDANTSRLFEQDHVHLPEYYTN